MRNYTWIAIAAALLLSGCVYPTSKVEQGGTDGSLYFPRASVGTRVIVDGNELGDALAYDGRKAVLGVASGPHRVVLRQGTATLYDRQVYVGSAARLAIEVP